MRSDHSIWFGLSEWVVARHGELQLTFSIWDMTWDWSRNGLVKITYLRVNTYSLTYCTSHSLKTAEISTIQISTIHYRVVSKDRSGRWSLKILTPQDPTAMETTEPSVVGGRLVAAAPSLLLWQRLWRVLVLVLFLSGGWTCPSRQTCVVVVAAASFLAVAPPLASSSSHSLGLGRRLASRSMASSSSSTTTSPPSFALNPSETACVFIEYQNEFTTPGGKLHDAVEPVMERTGMLQHSAKLAEMARSAGCTIIHCPISFEPVCAAVCVCVCVCVAVVCRRRCQSPLSTREDDHFSIRERMPATKKLTHSLAPWLLPLLPSTLVICQGHKEINPNPYGILAGVKDGGAFVSGQWGADFCESMRPHPNDLIVKGKSGLCGFASTNLDFLLRQHNIQNVVLAGFLTNCCVESR